MSFQRVSLAVIEKDVRFINTLLMIAETSTRIIRYSLKELFLAKKHLYFDKEAHILYDSYIIKNSEARMQNLIPQDYVARSQNVLYMDEYGCSYVAGRLIWQDVHRHHEYQRMRAKVFVETLGWDIPVDAQGRERDRYDQENEATTFHCVYGKDEQTEYILGGVRLIAMKHWSDSMLFNEFRGSEFIPESVAHLLASLDCQTYIEITRFCVQQGRLYPPLSIAKKYQCSVARDLTYAGVYALSRQLNRPKAIGIAQPAYLKIMRLGHFQFSEIHQTANGSLVIIDLWQTIRAIQEAGDYRRVQRMLWHVSE